MTFTSLMFSVSEVRFGSRLRLYVYTTFRMSTFLISSSPIGRVCGVLPFLFDLLVRYVDFWFTTLSQFPRNFTDDDQRYV